MERKLPEGWEWKILGDIAKVESGGTPSTRDPENFGGFIPWITPADLSICNNEFVSRGSRNITEKGLKSSSAVLLPKGSVIFSSRAPIGYVAIASNEIATNQGCKSFVIQGESILNEYVYHYLKANKQLAESYASGTTFLELSASKAKKIPIPLPPIETQRRIVAILDKAEETRRLRAQADELAGRLISDAFIDMFGDLSRNPNIWKMRRIEEIAERITDGEHITPIRSNEGIYLLSARNIQNHKISLKDVDFIEKEEYERISKRIVPQKGDILVSCSGTIGRVARVKEDFIFQMVRSVALIRIKSNSNILDPVFLEYVFDTNFMKNQILKSVNQSSQANLFQGKIQKLLIPIPPIDLQYKFAHIAKNVESMKNKLEESNNKINNLLNNLMQKAFNGELIS